MEIIYYLSSLFLILFMVLATYDGLYLHLWKYELFKKKKSVFEHKTHTIRAILFPLIVWLLFINKDDFSFYIGLSLVLIDLVVLAIDAYSEKDSRQFMGGLPKWEYIIHLFSNGFHFAATGLLLATRVNVIENGLSLSIMDNISKGQELLNFISVNIIPGAILMALLHLFFIFPKGIKLWDKLKSLITTKRIKAGNKVLW